MDKNTKKVLKLTNKLSKKNVVDIETLIEKSKLPKDDFFEIGAYLIENHFIKIPKSGFAETTNKGKTYLQSIKFKWFFNNILSIIAIIISIIALFK